MYAIRMQNILSELQHFEVRANIYATVVLAVIFVLLFRRKKQRTISSSKDALIESNLAAIPGPRPWPLLGNVSILLNRRVPIWDLILIVQKQLCALYATEGIFRIWTFGRQSVFLFKPHTVEALITSNVNINKSEEYRFAAPWLRTGKQTQQSAN